MFGQDEAAANIKGRELFVVRVQIGKEPSKDPKLYLVGANTESHSATWFPEPPLPVFQEGTAQTTLPKKGHHFLAQNIRFILMSFVATENNVCAGLPDLCLV